MSRIRSWCLSLSLCASMGTGPWLVAQNVAPQNPRQTERTADKSTSKESDARSMSLPSERGTDVKSDIKSAKGEAGETHQTSSDKNSTMTTDQGVPVSDNQNTLRQGARGPALLEDFVMREKLFRFDHERIPERVVHARGFGAHGYFETYESLKDITKADLFQRAGEKTPVFVRFSTVAAARVHLIWLETFADSQSSSIPKKAIGTSLAIISRSSSSRIP